MKLQNKTAVVTGAGQGLGRAISLKLAEAGATIIIADIKPETSAETAALIKNQFHRESMVVMTNVRREDAVVHLADKVQKTFGSLDILVNNSGIAGPRAAVEDISLDEWNESIEVNLTGVFLMCKHFAPMLKAKEKSFIVNIASVAGMRPLIMRMPYIATKAAILAVTKAMAMEFGPQIRVNSICPGAIDGPRQTQVLQKVADQTGMLLEEVIQKKKAESPLNTFIPPSAVGDAVVFLCSDEGSYLSGTNLNVSAGAVLG